MPLPEGATIASVGNNTRTRVVESNTLGKIALVEFGDYARGEAMGAISKRLGTRIVLLVKDGTLDDLSLEEIEEAVRHILGDKL